MSQIKLTGRVRARLFEYEGGPLIGEWEGPNAVVTVGKGLITGLLTGLGTTPILYMAIGTGTNAVVAGDTTLQTEISTGGGSRKAATVSQQTTGVTNDTARWVASYAFTSSFSVAEAGLFTAISSGSMLARKLFAAPVAVVNGNVLEVTWSIQAT